MYLFFPSQFQILCNRKHSQLLKCRGPTFCCSFLERIQKSNELPKEACWWVTSSTGSQSHLSQVSTLLNISEHICKSYHSFRLERVLNLLNENESVNALRKISQVKKLGQKKEKTLLTAGLLMWWRWVELSSANENSQKGSDALQHNEHRGRPRLGSPI